MKKDRVKANFEMDLKKWERFKKIAKYNESTAAQEMRKFINEYLSKNAQLEFEV